MNINGFPIIGSFPLPEGEPETDAVVFGHPSQYVFPVAALRAQETATMPAAPTPQGRSEFRFNRRPITGRMVRFARISCERSHPRAAAIRSVCNEVWAKVYIDGIPYVVTSIEETAAHFEIDLEATG